MKSFVQLFIARNKEFYRDKSSLSWAFILPILIIVGCAFAFSGNNQTILTIAYYPSDSQPKDLSALSQSFSHWMAYDDINTAKQRLAQHQLDAFVDQTSKTIWLNPESNQSLLIQQLLQGNPNNYEIEELLGQSIRYVDWVLPGVLGMNIMFASLFGVGYVLVRYRKNGVLKRLQATPISAFTFLSAQVASRLYLVVASNALIFIASWYLLDLVFVGSGLDLLITAIIGAMAMIALALLIACRTASEELAGGLLNTATWPMMFLSGIWFSLDDTPEAMQLLANFLPLTHLVNAARDIMINGASLWDVAPNLLALLLSTVICLLLAAKFFRWNTP